MGQQFRRAADDSRAPKRSSAEMAAEVASQLMWGPKSTAAIGQAVMPNSNNAFRLLQKYVDQFVASGCAYQCGTSAHRAPIYAWNPRPFAHLDAQKAGDAP